MILSNKNKKILEEILNCTIEFQQETYGRELYKIKGTINSIVYVKQENCYYITNDYIINILTNCNELVIMSFGLWSFGFSFIDDLKNIVI